MSAAEKLRRLSEMSGAELRFRVAQRLRIAREQWLDSPNGAAARPAAGDESFTPSKLLSRGTPAFFFSPRERESLAAAHTRLFPGRREEILAQAERICAHRFRIFAFPEVQAGEKIPWRRDLVHGKETRLDHWARIPYLDFETAGDSKIVWEPNRHQHFFTLGQAWFLSGDERYAGECLAQFEHWQQENPPRRGINWASSLEAAFRSWSWLWAMHLLAGSRALTPARLGGMTRALAQHARFISENLSTYFSPNTHLLGEGFALFAIGTLLPDLPGAAEWRETGRRVLLEQMDAQVRPDGSHAEQSSYYHLYATEFFLYAAILAGHNAIPFPAAWREKLARMVEYVLHLTLPSGRLPMFGDADGGRVLAVAPRVPHDPAPVLSVAGAFFRRADFAAAATRPREECFWLFDGHCEPAGNAAPPLGSRAFLDSGMVTFRAGSGGVARVLMFDAGPQGMPGSAHGHCDALSVVCAAGGVEWLTDPGTHVYSSDRASRDYFRSTAAHNTASVDGEQQAVPVDIFKWRDLPPVRLERWLTSRTVDFAAASHTGYFRLPQGILHRRHVLFVKPEYWLVSDEFHGSGAHSLEFFFHFTPGVRLESRHGAWLASAGSAQFLIVPPRAEGLELRAYAQSETPPAAGYSEDYGHRVPAPLLRATARATLDSGPLRFHWLLWPSAATWPQLREENSAGLALSIQTEAWTDHLAVRTAGKDAACADISSDAELLWVRRDTSGSLQCLTMLNGCCVDSAGRALLRAESYLDRLEMSRTGDLLEMDALPARAMRIYAPGATRVRVNNSEVRATRSGDWMELPAAAPAGEIF